MPKVIRLHEPEGAEKLLIDLLEDHNKDKLTGLVVIATTNDGKLHRWFYDTGRTCTQILGLIEYMKAYIFEWIKSDALENDREELL